jgi:transposase
VTRTKPETLDVEMDELDAIVEQAKPALNDDQHAKLKLAIHTLAYLSEQIEHRRMSTKQLQQLFFGKSTETAGSILKNKKPAKEAGNADGAKDTENTEDASPTDGASEATEESKGHGRNGAVAFTGAERICVKHGTLKAGSSCPECKKGSLYLQREPARIIRITGRAPIQASVYELERLRCGTCGEIFTAAAPEGMGDEKYDASAVAMIALLKYGSGLPFNRLEGLEENLGIPLPASSQWKVVDEAAKNLLPVLHEMIRQAAQGEVLHNDDTGAQILTRPTLDIAETDPSRKGIFTTGIVAMSAGRRIALYFTGHRHAGENLGRVLKQRATNLPPPIQMCDALSRNVPKDYAVILGHCLVHGRRNFVDVIEDFPDETKYVVIELGAVYHVDEMAKQRGLSADERLRLHQEESAPRMSRLKVWLEERLDQKLVEPSSGLGQAIRYMLKHWEALTLFLRAPGAPLDNNLCERALKKAILHRKNSLFFKTQHGADVGDLYFSLLHTAELAGTNRLDYLTTLLENADAVKTDPARWMPWNYAETRVAAAAAREA